MIDKILKDIKGLFKVQDKAKFLKQNIPYSGSNFERPNFKNMIDDLNKGKFSIIMVKDLSRFGRDYIESGKYLQKIFPEKGIRFISVNDRLICYE